VPVAFQLPRETAGNGLNYFVEQPGNTESAFPLNGAKRSWEILVNNAVGSASVSAQSTFFLKIVNAAHRESPSGFGTTAVDTSAVVVVQEGLNPTPNVNNVWHYQVLTRVDILGTTGSFIELPSISSLSATITVYPGANSVTNSFSEVTFNGTFGQNAVQLQLTDTGLLANTYQLVTITGTPSGQSYTLTRFDVTPSNNAAGTIDQEVIDLVTPTASLADPIGTNTAFLGATVFSTSNPSSSGFCCSNVINFPSDQSQNGVVPAPQSTSTVANNVNTVLTAGRGTGCNSATAIGGLSSITLSNAAFATGCGKRVTLLVGRPFTLTQSACGINSGLCSFQNNSVTVGVTGLDIAANSFFQSAPVSQTGGFRQFSFDVQTCACVSSTPTPSPCPTNCDILTAITGSSGSVTGTVSGLAGSIGSVLNAVGGVSSSLTNINTRISRLNATLLVVKNIEVTIKDNVNRIKHKVLNN